MDTIPLPKDFKEFLQFLNSERVEYLLVGGFAVGHYGYPRATGDMDIWVGVSQENAEKLVRVFRAFGFSEASTPVELFQQPRQGIRIGVPPLQIDVVTNISGVDFDPCFAARQSPVIDGVEVNLISLEDLKRNKRASGRPKDVDDLNHLAKPS
jgi:predicted nucleotidyltransferase